MTMMHFLDILGLTVLHALWQGAVVGLLVFAALHTGRSLTPASRHAIAGLGLVTFLTTSALTFGTLLLEGGGAIRLGETVSDIATTSMPIEAMVHVETGHDPATRAESTVGSGLESASISSRIAPLIGWCWMAGFGLMFLRLIRQWFLAHRLRIDRTSEPDERWLDVFNALKTRLSIDPWITMLVSGIVDSPMVVGWLRPVVLVPASAFSSLTPEQIETVLAHELHHIGRRDHLLNMIQGFIEIALFFHPVTWWLSRQVRIERENCCDDASLTVAGSPRSLAEALLTLETLRSPNITENSSLAATGGSLMQRISRLFESSRNQSRHVGWRALSSCTLAAVAGLSFATIAIDSTASAQDRGTTRSEQVDGEERLRTIGSEIRRKVADGEMTAEEGRARYEEAVRRMRTLDREGGVEPETRRRDADTGPDEELERLRIGIEARVRAMRENLARQVDAGEISEADAKVRFAEGERRMWSRYRAAEMERMETRRSRAGEDELAELKSGIEERLRVMGAELREQVAAGEMTEEEAGEKYQAMEKRMWSRYRAAEEARMKEKKQDEKPDRELEELKAGIQERLRSMGVQLREQVSAGEITDEEAGEKYEAMEKRLWTRYRAAEEKLMKGRKEADAGNRELEELKAGIEERLRAMGAELREQVAAGEMTGDQAREKYEAMEKRMWSRYRAAEEKQMKGRKEADAGNRELEELKVGIEERLRAMGAELREQVAAGEMTGDQAREKYEAMEERMWSRYRAAEEARTKEMKVKKGAKVKKEEKEKKEKRERNRSRERDD